MIRRSRLKSLRIKILNSTRKAPDWRSSQLVCATLIVFHRTQPTRTMNISKRCLALRTCWEKRWSRRISSRIRLPTHWNSLWLSRRNHRRESAVSKLRQIDESSKSSSLKSGTKPCSIRSPLWQKGKKRLRRSQWGTNLSSRRRIKKSARCKCKSLTSSLKSSKKMDR